jgi:hypothetical protein
MLKLLWCRNWHAHLVLFLVQSHMCTCVSLGDRPQSLYVAFLITTAVTTADCYEPAAVRQATQPITK